MALELVKEQIRVSQLIGDDTTQAVVEGDIIVPDSKPDVARIIQADGEVFVNNKSVMQDKVLVDGAVRFKILYLAQDQSLRSITNSIPFSQSFDIPGTYSGMRSTVSCNLEHIQCSIVNERKLNVNVVLGLQCRVHAQSEAEIVSDVRGAGDIQTLKERIGVNALVGETESTINLSEATDIPIGMPTIGEILRTDVRITDGEAKVIDNRALVRGDIVVTTLYAADDEERSIQYMKHELPFSEYVEIPEMSEESDLRFEVLSMDAQIRPVEDNDGELRVIQNDILLKVRLTATQQMTVQTVSDCYSPGSNIEIVKKPVNLEEPVGENSSQLVVKDSLICTGDLPEVSQIFNVVCRPVTTQCSIQDDKVVIEGVIHAEMLYLSNDEARPVSACDKDVPFRHVIDLKGARAGMACELESEIQHYSYNMVSAQEVEVRFVMTFRARVSRLNTVQVISRAEEQPLDDKRMKSRPGIILYYVQEGDTIWKIAKRYHTTMDKIIAANSIANPDAIAVGQQLLIQIA